MNTKFKSPLLALLLLLGALPAAAQTTLFTDDFGPKPLAAWKASPLGLLSNWSASSGAAVYNGGGHTQLYAGSGSWTDYTVQAQFKVDTANNYPGGIRGRVNPTTGASYAAWVYPGSSVIKLIRSAAWHIDTPGLAVLAEAPVGVITPGVFHTLAITFSGSQISVIYNGTTVIQVTDSTLASGAVALDVSNQPITFDDVTVTSGSTTLFADDFGPKPLANWTASPLGLAGNWDASSGVASYNGGGHTQLYAGDPAWTNYTVSAKVRVTNAADYPGGIRGRLDTATGGSYAAWIYPGQGKIKLWRNSVWHVDTPPTTILAEANVSIATGVFHALAIKFQGTRIQVSFNGTTVIDLTDATYAAGAIALDVSNQPIDYDDVTVTAPAPPPPTVQLFADDFASNSLANWTPSPLGLFSNWTAASGTASYNGGGHTQVYAGDPAWTDYTVSAKIRLANGNNYPGGLRGRVNTATGESYAAWIYPGFGKIRLYRAAAWDIDTAGLALLAEADVGTLDPNVWHTLAISFEGSRIQVSWNDEAVIDVTDTALASGAIALDVSNQPIDFDDVVVTQPSDGADNGPGGPVLVISSESNPFTRYYGEILLAEGLNHYAIREIGAVTATLLAGYDVVILGEMTLTSAQVTLLTDWVNAGGNLIAMRPDAQLATLLGITPVSGTLAEGYLLASASGIVNETIQYHGTADLYTLNGATAIATLYTNATTATSNPAVTLQSVGSSGGQAAAFTYDLARSIVYTRQGNPAWASQERDGVTPIRSDDLFFPDWIDLNKVAIPQADEQQRLLANLILTLNADRKPLPRFWYFPRGEKAIVLMTGDDHANNGTLGRFQSYQLASPSGCSVADWECVRGTSYIFPNTPLTSVDAEALEADGFEIAVHVNTNCADWTPATLETFYTTQLASFTANYPTLDAPTTNRTHCIVWSDWATQPKVEKANGIRLDTNYYYWPGAWITDRPGFMTGSGLPMRFADTDGTRIDVYQALTQMTDESDQSFPATINTLLDNALGTAGYYGVMTANMHTDSASSSGSDAIITSALTRGVPVVSARQLLTWLDGRNGSKFSAIAWSGNTLTFTVTAAPGANGLRGMIPTTTAAGSLASLTVGGNSVTFTTETIKGISYAIFPASSGSYTATYAP
ncbi:MAG TPA: family 16 glycoside hydrolase [Thermoanaerobaculia bacterium]|nr:family 16 glycoside hydrolase [Thermoanaerobaculia bacterium]